MTDTETKIEVLKECMETVNAVPLTELAPDFQILYSSLPYVEVMAMFMEMESERQGFEYQFAVQNVESQYHGSTNVNVFTNFLGMAWISDIWFEAGVVKRIYMLGPVFLDDYSLSNLEKRLNELELSLPLKHRFMKYILSTPVVSLSRFYEYGIMLHYCVTGEKISAYDFIYPDYQKKEFNDDIFSVKHGTYLAEQELLKMVEDGNPEYEKIMGKNLFIGSGSGLCNSGYLRREQNTVITLIVLCSRAAIRGGLASETALSLCDYYVRKVDVTDDFAGLLALSQEAVKDFVTRVHRLKAKESQVSPQIRKACDYIELHLQQKPDIHSLASMLGYSDYYFSNKFRQETGKTVRDYITDCKIHRAKTMLRETSMSVQDISDALGYGSQSYFGDVFKKRVGVSPGEYRLKIDL